jgi:hypothetical protein
LHKQFQAIKSSDDKPTYCVTPKTIGYIHWIITDCITSLPSNRDACNQRDLQNEIMILKLLEGQEPAVFSHTFFNNLTNYYKDVQSRLMSGGGGRPTGKPKHFKHTMRVDGGVLGGGE